MGRQKNKRKRSQNGFQKSQNIAKKRKANRPYEKIRVELVLSNTVCKAIATWFSISIGEPLSANCQREIVLFNDISPLDAKQMRKEEIRFQITGYVTTMNGNFLNIEILPEYEQSFSRTSLKKTPGRLQEKANYSSLVLLYKRQPLMSVNQLMKQVKGKEVTTLSGPCYSAQLRIMQGKEEFKFLARDDKKDRPGGWIVPTLEEAPLNFIREYNQSLPWNTVLHDEHNRSFASFCANPFEDETLATWMQTILNHAPWTTPYMKGVPVNRKQAWFTDSDCKCSYGYSDQVHQPVRTPDWLLEIQEKVFSTLNLPFRPNCCNMNLYTTSQSALGYHADDEDLFQGKFQDCAIVSLSLGVRRNFFIRHRKTNDTVTQELGFGDIVTMEGRMQRFYVHAIGKGDINSPFETRVNLTWRTIVAHRKKDKCPIAFCDSYSILPKIKPSRTILAPQIKVRRPISKVVSVVLKHT